MNKIPCTEKVWIPLNVLEKRNLICAKVVDNPRKATPEVAVQLILQTCNFILQTGWLHFLAAAKLECPD